MARTGFSLVELMIYMTLLGLISIGVFTAYNFFVTSGIEARSLAEVQQDSQLALDPIRSRFANADRVDVLSLGDQQCAIASSLDSTTRAGLNFTATEKLVLDQYKGPSGSSPRSIGFWMVQYSQDVPQSLLGFGRPSASQKWLIYSDQSSGAIGVDIHGKQIVATTDVVDGNWHHVMVVFDARISEDLNADSVAIYIDGKAEGLITTTGRGRVNTDNTTVNLTIGGYDTDSSFTGQMASIKIWHRALAPSEIWPEVLSPRAENRDQLALELELADSITDTSPQAHGLQDFPEPIYKTLVNAYGRKTSYAFGVNPDNSGFHHLWQLDYIDTTPEQNLDRCPPINSDEAWSKTSDYDWLKTRDDFFTLSDGVLTINAEVAKRVAGSTISASDNSLILVGQGLAHNELCRIAPNINGFNIGGGGNIGSAEAVVLVDDSSFETSDSLHFFDATKSGPFTATINSVTKTYYTYKDISANGSVLWPDITAEYEPARGVMKICTATDNNCDNPSPTPQPLESWQKLFRAMTYSNSSQTYRDEKVILFSLGGGIPCRVNNQIACRNTPDNDGDNNPATCYHWFNFIAYGGLGSSYACHTETGTGAANYNQCPADWEDARQDAESDGRKLFGLTGYLATITTPAESLCAFERIAGASGWIGGSDRHCERNRSCGNPADNTDTPLGAYGQHNSKDPMGEGHWYWVTGPEGEWNDTEQGYSSHDGTGGQGLYFGHDNGSLFTSWASDEPNNWVNSGGVFPEEDYLHALRGGRWNDFTSYYTSAGFVIEYGGLAADPERVLTKHVQINTFEFLKNCPPN